jgi:hypothetical protein
MLAGYYSVLFQVHEMQTNKAMITVFLSKIAAFEEWFNRRFGWFFTNGSKRRS